MTAIEVERYDSPLEASDEGSDIVANPAAQSLRLVRCALPGGCLHARPNIRHFLLVGD